MLFERFSETAAKYPDRPAVIDPHRQITFRQLHAAAASVGRRIAELSPEPADPVCILAPSSVGFAVAFFGIQSAGRAACPLNLMLAPAELARVVADSGTRLIVTAEALMELAEGLAPGGGVAVACLEGLLADAGTPRPGTAATRPGRPIDLDQTAVLLYTSGSTGQPKGVMLSAGNLLADALGCIRHAEMDPEQHFLGVLPLFHTFGLTGMLLIPSLLGSTAYYLPRFHPRQVLEVIAGQRISVLMAIPSMYGAILKAAGDASADLGDCRLPICGGEPLAGRLAEQFGRRFGRPILEGYGLTETSPVVTLNVPRIARAGTVGRPLPDVRVTIIDEHDRPCPTGQHGEIVVHGPIVMRGYYHRPDETRATLTPDGGLRTGDIGRLDADGFLAICGRKKEMIIVGGENVFPCEVEQVLAAHPKVARCAVISLPDGTHGEVVAAFVSPADPADLPDVAELRAFCRDRLAGYKVPRRFEILPELPVGPTGKVLKRQLPARGQG